MSKQVIVAGCHRSMTSGVAEGLHKAKIPMGGRMRRNGNGGHGFWEDRAFYNLNIAILTAAGGDWKNPPPRKAIVAAGDRFHDQCARLVAARNRRQGIWGWKDPRNCLTLPVWLGFVNPQDTHIVGVFRHPEQVAASLTRRDGWPEARGLALANVYNRRLLDEIERFLTR